MFGKEEKLKLPTQETLDHGYQPLEYREGEFYTPEGNLVRPMYQIGHEEWHRQLFIEYERTFGRGNAFDITHQAMGKMPVTAEGQKIFFEKYGKDVRTAYNKLTRAIPLMGRGSQEQCETFIQGLKEYRRSHTALYEDKPGLSKPKKMFEIQK
ncbi:MAG: hypothetical protein Q8P01_03520 [bacterium]|nr:hypothetical protein [bacterium]